MRSCLSEEGSKKRNAFIYMYFSCLWNSLWWDKPECLNRMLWEGGGWTGGGRWPWPVKVIHTRRPRMPRSGEVTFCRHTHTADRLLAAPAVWAACGGELLSNTGLKSKIQKQVFMVRNHSLFSCLGILTNVRGMPSGMSVGWHHPPMPLRMLLAAHATSFLPRSTVKRGTPQCFSSLLKRIWKFKEFMWFV